MKSLNIKTIIALSTLFTSIFLISYGNNNEAIQEYYSGEEIFRGIFFYSNFYKITDGTVVIMPKEKRQFLMTTIKGITKIGGEKIEFSEPEGFMDEFLVYANCDINPDKLISQSILESILEYQSLTQKDIYVSIVGSEIYIAVSEPKDILEPRLLRSNANFELVKDFFEDLMLIISIIEDFDLHY